MNEKLKNFGNYAIPVLCLLNVILASNVDAALGWVVAFAGWVCHLIEVRKTK